MTAARKPAGERRDLPVRNRGRSRVSLSETVEVRRPAAKRGSANDPRRPIPIVKLDWEAHMPVRGENLIAHIRRIARS